MPENADSIDAQLDWSWDETVAYLEKNLATLPNLHREASVSIETKKGEKLNCEIVYWSASGYEDCSSGDFTHIVIVRNSKGEAIGTRISKLYDTDEGMVVNSLIELRDKGRGYAMPIETVFMNSLQQFSDKLNKKVIWKIVNGNRDAFIKYKWSDDPDPKFLAALEEEQKRWQTLYGEGGKLGVVKGKKVFSPRLKIESLTEEVGKKINEIS